MDEEKNFTKSNFIHFIENLKIVLKRYDDEIQAIKNNLGNIDVALDRVLDGDDDTEAGEQDGEG